MIKTIAAALTLSTLALATPAMAKDINASTFKATISYNADAPVETTYKRLKKQSKQACKAQVEQVHSVYLRTQYVQSCTDELMSSAVKKVGNSALIQYHAMQNGAEARTQLAEKATTPDSRLP